MKRPVAFALLLLLGLTACSHRQPQTTAAAPISDDAAYTGVTHYPRAYPVALPAQLPAASATTPLAHAVSPVSAAPAEVATGTTPAATNSTSSSVPSTASETNPAPPSPSTSSPEPMDASEAASAPTPPTPAPASPSPATPASGPFTAPSAGPPQVEPLPSPLPSPFRSDQVVVLETSFGRIVIELDDFAAPKTCANFRHLVNSGFYNGTIFHRVIPHFIIQGGDPNTKLPDRAHWGQGDPGYTLPPEIKLHHDRGAVAMARLPDSVNPQRYSNGSQFFICVVPCPSLDDQYTVFAHVIAGLDVADRIASAPADGRNDPIERIALKASFEPRDRALRGNAATGP